MQKNHNYVAIMAGGVGSRFWPASRENMPKQFLDILGIGKSLLRLTYERFLSLCPSENIFVVTNMQYKGLVLEHIPELSDNQVLCEPSRNNTGPSVAYTAFKLFHLDPEANFVIAPSDHVIMKEAAFIEKLKTALAYSKDHEALITLGITPTRPDTGYGYIYFGAAVNNNVHLVLQFKEKPDLETAKEYLESGDYLWNAGIFVWKATTILNSIQRNAPEIYEILEKGASVYNTPREQGFIDDHYPTTPNISVDFAIMEKARNVYSIPSDIGWSDLGTWSSLHNFSEKDQDKNVIHSDDFVISETKNCFIRVKKDKIAVIKGLDNFIVIEEDDVLLIYPKEKEQEIKQVRQGIEEKYR